jgi:hypothetical protein
MAPARLTPAVENTLGRLLAGGMCPSWRGVRRRVTVYIGGGGIDETFAERAAIMGDVCGNINLVEVFGGGFVP